MAAEREARVERVVAHAPGTRTLVLRLPPGERLAFRPGQFVSCLLPVGGERLIRPYSIASSPEEPARLEILLDLVPGGPGSRHLFGLGPGDRLRFTGPWGTFVLDRPPDAEAVFVAAETGIAPIRPMLRRAAATAVHPLRLLYGTALGLYHDELAALPGVTVEVVAPRALEAAVAARFIQADDDRSRHFYLCGVGEQVTRLRDGLRAAGYARRAVQYEKW
ncbi:MAG TPA: FAD-binding oxidoreductase [Candidatus Binatia bacterium]|nr:FAD-binding oxidoreductase [Candidatus Binatia bacterium]